MFGIQVRDMVDPTWVPRVAAQQTMGSEPGAAQDAKPLDGGQADQEPQGEGLTGRIRTEPWCPYVDPEAGTR
jgi:hypothetical protein